MLTWEVGVFELDPPDENASHSEVIDLSAQEVLMEAFRQKDELGQLHARLPPLTAKVSVTHPSCPS